VHDRGFLVIKDLLPIRMIGAMQDITERKKVEEKYFESEFRFKTIFEAEPECVKLVDANGKLMEMNTAGLVMLEAESIDQINAHSLVDFVLPKYRNDYIELHKQVMKGKDGYIEYEALGLKGTKRWMETNAVPIIDINGSVSMMLSVTRDISKRKQEEHHLRLLESVITNTNDSIMITEAEPFDEPGPKIVYVNDAFTKMTGYSKVEVIGKSPRILQGPNSDKNLLNGMGELMRKWKPCEVTVINYKKNGEEFWNNFSIKPIADEIGWYTHWIAVERDITQQKNNDLEREQIISELSQNNKDLKQFSYVTSHNLRAPIANLLGLTSLIDQYKIPNKSLKQIIDGIKQSAIMFDDTVKDLTKVLIIKDQTNVIKEDVSLVTVINNVLKQLSISVDDNDIKINYELNNAPFVNFTTTYMESVFLNLFTNSIKYKSPLRKLKIDISSSNFNDYIELKFKDNGIGIDIDKHKEKIFKLYQRFHDNPDGKGLGLYLIKSQIEALGGTIRVESIVGKETMFVMKFKK
jgi:PAS domain S-box-containing protein